MLLTFPSPSFPELLLFVETRVALPGTENPLIPAHPLERVGNKASTETHLYPSLSTRDFPGQGNSQGKAKGF